ncbi:MAG: hypothetical protein JXA46_11490 [Dehalococcoidales bacterium]|nr:hypothetical protein [Dehalococcoidales bacterium]
METIDLEPRYSTTEIPGRCIRCLAEEKLFSCMRELLKEDKEDNDDPELQNKYELLRCFLESPELQEVCDKSENSLSDGKEVMVRITMSSGKPKYEIFYK